MEASRAVKRTALQCYQNHYFLFLPSLLSLALSYVQDHPSHHLPVKHHQGRKSCVSGFCLGSRYSFRSTSVLRAPCEGHGSVLRPFTSSGGWDDWLSQFEDNQGEHWWSFPHLPVAQPLEDTSLLSTFAWVTSFDSREWGHIVPVFSSHC